jgi:small GTP-binding protein
MSSIPNFKFIVIGSSGVGKTAILKRLIEDTFTEESLATIGVEFDTTLLMVDNRRVKLQIWDTAGQERFRSIAKAYYRGAVGVILVYDLADRKTFDDLPNWIADIRSLCEPNAVVMLIANKADLAARRVVTPSEAEEFASLNHILYMETSAKAGQNIREAFVRVAAAILGRKIVGGTAGTGSSPVLDGAETPSDKPKCC